MSAVTWPELSEMLPLYASSLNASHNSPLYRHDAEKLPPTSVIRVACGAMAVEV